MITTDTLCPAGATIGLSVTASAHAPVQINAQDASADGLFICNTSTAVTIYVNVASANGSMLPTAANATIPGDGTAGSIPILAYDKIILAGLQFPVSISAIGSGAGPTVVTATPVKIL
jgi:hypothetical protein